MSKNKKNVRYIKDEYATIPMNTKFMEPITNTLKQLPHPVCLKKMTFENNNIQYLKNYKCQNNVNNYDKILFIPPIGISSSELLKMYNIMNIDDLNMWFEKSIIEDNYLKINRILNCWIRINFDTLKNHSKNLENIYYKFISKHNKSISDEKEIKKFINNWIDKKSSDEFDFDLLDDLLDFLRK